MMALAFACCSCEWPFSNALICAARQIDGMNGSPRVRGRVIDVEFREAMADGSLRHPRFSGWRDESEITEFESGRAKIAA